MTDTAREITLTAGRELDALVAEKILGCEPVWSSDPSLRHHGAACHCGGYMNGDKPHRQPPTNELKHYSEDIAAAWQVVEKLHWIHLESYYSEEHGYRWSVNIIIPRRKNPEGKNVVAYADTAPLAICHAALKWADEQ